jgi:hypothetical protein
MKEKTMSNAKQYHFVVMYDTETKEWSTAPDVSVNHDNGDVWLEEESTWNVNRCETDEENAITDAIAIIMNNAKAVEGYN